jgi:hemoglobin
MVDHFYEQVRADPMLGPVFESRLAGRWPAHLDKMVDFWTSALLGAGRYAGNPRAAHAALPDLSPHHFERWLELFEQTLAATFDAAAAAQIHARARAMAQGLMRGIRNHRPGLPMTEAPRGAS